MYIYARSSFYVKIQYPSHERRKKDSSRVPRSLIKAYISALCEFDLLLCTLETQKTHTLTVNVQMHLFKMCVVFSKDLKACH